MALQTYEDIDLTDFMCVGFKHSWNIRDFPCTNSRVVKWDYLLDLNNSKVLLSVVYAWAFCRCKLQ